MACYFSRYFSFTLIFFYPFFFAKRERCTAIINFSVDWKDEYRRFELFLCPILVDIRSVSIFSAYFIYFGLIYACTHDLGCLWIWPILSANIWLDFGVQGFDKKISLLNVLALNLWLASLVSTIRILKNRWLAVSSDLGVTSRNDIKGSESINHCHCPLDNANLKLVRA
jgi:hypothetical protein